MGKNKLSKDLETMIKKLTELVDKHEITNDPELPVSHVHKALSELEQAKIDAIINEIVKEQFTYYPFFIIIYM